MSGKAFDFVGLDFSGFLDWAWDLFGLVTGDTKIGSHPKSKSSLPTDITSSDITFLLDELLSGTGSSALLLSVNINGRI